MGSARTLTTTAATAEPRRLTLARAVDVLVGSVLLVLALPVLAVLALAVRHSSTGPVLRRERTRDRRGRPVELLSFRTTLDGGTSAHHERVRAVVGAGEQSPVTGAGRLIRATRTERLPRLLNVVRGDSSLFN